MIRRVVREWGPVAYVHGLREPYLGIQVTSPTSVQVLKHRNLVLG